MKKLSLLILCFLPLSLHAAVDIFHSADKDSYHPLKWSGDITPEEIHLLVEYRYAREEFPLAYSPSHLEARERFFSLFPELTIEERRSYIQKLSQFSKDGLIDYLATVLWSEIDTTIEEKQSLAIILTPYEEVFLACNIPLAERRDIIRTLIEDIYHDSILSLEMIEYSDIRFWDCVIPFPDNRRSTSDILDLSSTFESNRYMARTIESESNFLRFGSREQNVSILWLSESWFTLTESLNIDSERIESSHLLEKSHWKNRFLYAHKNHYINPFRNIYIQGNQISWYDYKKLQIFHIDIFWPSHPLYISESASEQERTILPWTEIQAGVYTKILLQEDTYDSTWNPRQNVWVTSYYAILYNHDITPPYCEGVRYSKDNAWHDSFSLDVDEWYNEYRHISFVCGDPESWCRCDTDMTWCYIRDNWVMSTPHRLEHLWASSAEFINQVWKTVTCESEPSELIRYDFWSPDMILLENNSEISPLTREFVSNNGILFDWEQITSKRYFSFREIWEYRAGEIEDIVFQIFDIPSPDTQQDQSWLANFEIEVYRYRVWVWQKIWEIPLTTLDATVHNISLQQINDAIVWIDIEHHVWQYQLVIHVHDNAQNSMRAIWQYHILPWEIDSSNSAVSVSQRATQLADNSSTYEYQIELKDSFSNPIVGLEVISLTQSCEGADNSCRKIRLDMTGESPSGDDALDIQILSSWVSDESGRIYFEIRSLVPGTFSERFEIWTSFWDNHTISWETNTFLKPITWVLETYENGDWYDDRLFVWEERQYRVRMSIDWLTVNPTYTLDWVLRWRHPETGFILSEPIIYNSQGLEFTWTFHSTLWEFENHKNLLETVDAQELSWVTVSYEIWGETVRYKLTTSSINDFPLMLTDRRPLNTPVRLIWMLQGVWNHHNPSERQNFSDITQNLLRADMRRNIHQFIRSMQSGTTFSDVHYIDLTHAPQKNYTPPSNPDYKTLIVRNWNILINSDFNWEWKSIWLISYMDSWYDITNWYTQVWNIFISPSVTHINAFIYADWGLISTRQNGQPFISLWERQDILRQQLYMKWAIFSRNTIAGGNELWWMYMLPWSRQTTNEYLAQQYDFYYLRRWNDGCDVDEYGFCLIPQYVIIEHDNRILTSPPPLFSR